MNVYENCTDIASNMGRLIRARREEMHLTQEELAGRVNCDVRTLRRWETDGLNKLDTADLVLRELGVDLWDILSERAGIPFFISKADRNCPVIPIFPMV